MPKKILLTGSTGMLGRNILDNTNSSRYKFITPSRFDLDLTNYENVYYFINNHKPDIIIHAAAKVGGIASNIRNPIDFLIRNIDISRNVILAAKNSGIKELLNIGSSCMYPKNSNTFLKESDILTGELEPTNEGYALAKIFSLKLCEYINRENSNYLYKTIIPCNLYGKYDNFDLEKSHLVPAIIDKLHKSLIYKKNEISIWGDGTARREFMLASDLAEIIFKIIENFKNIPTVMNIGTGKDYSVTEYYSIASGIINPNAIFSYDLKKPVGMRRKIVSTEKMDAFSFFSFKSIEDGIRETYKFYLENYCDL